MSDHTLFSKLAVYKGCKLNDAIDAIESTAHGLGYSVLVRGPDAPPNIDSAPKRLNVRQDERGVITGFTIG
jgi:hypothetical protein